jgi:hypothetical protein
LGPNRQWGQPINHPQASGFIVAITANTPGATSGPGVLDVSPTKPGEGRPQQGRRGFTTADSSGEEKQEQEQEQKQEHERTPPPISVQQFATPFDSSGGSSDVSFLTYTCCTHSPQEYGEGTNGYSLKVNELNRRISLAICVTMYNESAHEARSTLQQVTGFQVCQLI